MKRDTIEKIKLLKEREQEPTTDALKKFTHRLRVARNVVEDYYLPDDNSDQAELARCNYITNIVTAFEVYLKDLIIERSEVWQEAGYSELLKETISLNDAYSLFKDIKIKRDVISS